MKSTHRSAKIDFSRRQSDSRFDAAYYRRHYGNPRTAVTSRTEMQRRADFIGGFVRYMGLPVRTILDAGCGLGWLRRPLLQQFPKARYVGLEFSEYLSRRYGWTHGSLPTFAPPAPFDLTICYDVLQYLKESEARRAMANLGRITRGVLYFSALTQEDWDFHCDRQRTDREVHLRPADWYRQRLAARFYPLGGGLYLRKNVAVQLWELERIAETSRSARI